ncbi:MAG: TatD family hydrolase [Candidatus Buchananbacteria bacterium]
MLVDSHAHLNFEDFLSDWQKVIADCQENNIWMINVGSQLATSAKAVSIAQDYKRGVYAAIGLHPIHTLGSQFHPEEFRIDDYRQLIKQSKKVVAIGETGLDFFHEPENIKKQQETFIEHINLAKEFDLPLILHSRNSKNGQLDAYDEILKIIKKENYKKGVIHCFSGTLTQALAFVEQGLMVGFTGIITFDKTGNLAEVAKRLPLSSILIETDCPYLAPEPHRGERNEPAYVQFTAEKIAKIKEIDYNEIAEKTAQNAINLFKLS